MITVRLVDESESETFLQLMCEVFELDANRAREVFYNEALFRRTTRWALFAEGEMQSVLTATPLEFGWGRAIGIAGVGTRVASRRQGYAGRLLLGMLQHARASGFGGAMLFARQTLLYDRLGFELTDEVVRSNLPGGAGDPPILRTEDVRHLYDEWAEQSPHRLRRTAGAWERWASSYRVCHNSHEGYVCWEVNQVREAPGAGPSDTWPVPSGVEWYGSRAYAKAEGISLEDERRELFVMTCGFTAPPQMFMSDQF